MTEKIQGPAIIQNMVSLGATFAIIDYDFEVLKNVLNDTFGKKGEKNC